LLHGLVAGRRAKRQDRALTREELAQPLGGAMREGVLDPKRPPQLLRLFVAEGLLVSNFRGPEPREMKTPT
jgi:hypothetical protein